MGKGQDLYKKAKELIPGGTQLLSKRPEMYLPNQWPAYYSRAKGVQVWDMDDRCYVDMSVHSVGACPLGYADEDVDRAVIDAVSRGNVSTLNPPEEVELAELIIGLHPWADMVRYARGGGDAMAVAVRIARAHTKRSKVAFCGYHGWGDWYLAANLTEANALGNKGLLLPGLEPSGVPASLAGSAYGFKYNRADELREIVRRNQGEMAAIICEPQRSVKPMPGFLEEVKQIAQKEGAVLIFDEVSSAMRLNTGGVHLLYGIKPDIAVFAKAISNGFPMAIVLGTGDVMQAAQTTFISSTYWTDRIGPTAAIATIRKHQRIDAGSLMKKAGFRVLAIWEASAKAAGIAINAGHPDMSPLSHFSFEYPEARAIRTLYCQMMLDEGYLDNAAFYATCAHTDAVLNDYETVAGRVFSELAKAIEGGAVQSLLRGPVGHSGFARLT
jgi:glutamate-1-semialdehyde 2,1-aminomutase